MGFFCVGATPSRSQKYFVLIKTSDDFFLNLSSSLSLHFQPQLALFEVHTDFQRVLID